MSRLYEVPSRKIVLFDHIDQFTAREVVAQIMDINEYDNERSRHQIDGQPYEPEPIEIYINSGGGSAVDGFAIISAMEMSQTPIVTIAMGVVASMALGIFVKGDIRIATKYVRFMYHSVSYGVIGHITDHEDEHKEATVLQDMYDSLFKETGLSERIRKEVKSQKKNLFMSATSAKELGIVDEVADASNTEI